MPNTTRTSYEGVIDADGHINEPHDLWERYLEPQYRDRAIRLGIDADGRERMQVGGKPSRYLNADLLARGRGMGFSFEDRDQLTRSPYKDSIPFGGNDPKERLQLLDYEGLRKAFIYPTIALEWESEVTDLELATAYCRAYNRWATHHSPLTTHHSPLTHSHPSFLNQPITLRTMGLDVAEA